MPYEFLEEVATADIAFVAQGKELEELFLAAGNATVNAMIFELETIALTEQRHFTLENDELDMLLFNYLQEFLYYKDSEQLLLLGQQVTIAQKNGVYHLEAIAKGETLDPDRHEQRVDVKAVTLHQFKLESTPEGWIAMVILDI
ncbi:archease [Laspinema olomoucense]|uniref:Archease n=1 Tax=Laspinema olomoucense D3b TaxID=2953688 RepID=A0ABT2NDM0_9CYAN|nr:MULTISPECIES: archease [unclassified Laspinema]MCT7980778.1 archease [Laspinema sp. D3b]MCT7988072.1 archease [Laspinema sp. D3a]